MSEQHGPARQLVERALNRQRDHYGAESVTRQTERQYWDDLAAIRAEADALDARIAALVEAAERMLDWRASPILEGETLEDAERWAKVLYGELRAALDAAKGEA